MQSYVIERTHGKESELFFTFLKKFHYAFNLWENARTDGPYSLDRFTITTDDNGIDRINDFLVREFTFTWCGR